MKQIFRLKKIQQRGGTEKKKKSCTGNRLGAGTLGGTLNSPA